MLELDDSLFADLVPLQDAELGASFDELVAMAAEQPEDSIALRGLERLIESSYQRGDLEAVAQMAMTLGAMACLDPHFETIANQAGDLVDQHSSDDGHGHDSQNKDQSQDSKNCKACKGKRYCPYGHAKHPKR